MSEEDIFNDNLNWFRVFNAEPFNYNYSKLLECKEWIDKSADVLNRDQFNCAKCGNKNNLEVHHKYYVQGLFPWDYSLDALITLCSNCHNLEHSKTKIEFESINDHDSEIMELKNAYHTRKKKIDVLLNKLSILYNENSRIEKLIGKANNKILNCSTDDELLQYFGKALNDKKARVYAKNVLKENSIYTKVFICQFNKESKKLLRCAHNGLTEVILNLEIGSIVPFDIKEKIEKYPLYYNQSPINPKDSDFLFSHGELISII